MQQHILTALTAWRQQLAAEQADMSDLLLNQLAHDLRLALAAVEAERTRRLTAYRAETQSARLYRQRHEQD